MKTTPGSSGSSGSSGRSGCELVIATPMRPGAIAIVQLIGDVEPVLAKLTGRLQWPVARSRLCALRDIDDAVVARISDDVAQIMPHGGQRVIQRLRAALVELGAAPIAAAQADPMKLYPEASDAYEALMLAALARAQSPLAIDLLLDQPQRWRTATTFTAEDEARSQRLNRLIDPPMVVVAGPPNVGKSTLSNRLMGRMMSIDADMPGTTRDYTAGCLNLAGLVVNWFDTPGLRDGGDAIESEAIRLARRLMESADCIVAMTDADHDWPALPREPDLKVANKCDLRGRRRGRGRDDEVSISARTGEGIDALVRAVRGLLLPNIDLKAGGPWRFDSRLSAADPGR